MSPSYSIERRRAVGAPVPFLFYFPLFLISGFPALLYQIVWQRALFTIYGVNVESVTVIVTVFMLGLGLGSVAGGRLSRRQGLPLLGAFGTIEISIGAFGAVSLAVFHRVSLWTAGASTARTGILAFLLLLIPTLLMGSTLPLLVAHLVGKTRNVGESVSSLYSVNTLGSSMACFAAAFVLMRALGESGVVRLAAVLNLLVGLTALFLQRRHPVELQDEHAKTRCRNSAESERRETIHFGAGMLLCAVAGFVSLAYEIIWYRLYSFETGGPASGFAKLLGFYLLGIAYGSHAVRDVCSRKLKSNLQGTLEGACRVVVLGGMAGFLLGPAMGLMAQWTPYDLTFPFVFIAAALLGSAFPLIAHAAINPAQDAGSRIGYLYVSNILGAALGSLLVGFVIMDRLSTRATSSVLLSLGISLAIFILALKRPVRPSRAVGVGVAASLCLLFLSGPLYSDMYEKLLFKSHFTDNVELKDLVENRSGVIAVGQDETVYGGGVYDGRFSTDLVHDRNGIFRAYVISGLHPRPGEVLVIGLSSGSWAQVLLNNPSVTKMTIVEINRGYLPLIEKRPLIAGLLRDPRVKIVVDDGRRWLVGNANQKFDFILMNTTFHWRANASNLLSVEFLKLIRAHLNPGGIAYYNTTSSREVQLTAASVFPYALRISNFIAVSDTAFSFDRARLERLLSTYSIDGRPVFNLKSEADRVRLKEVVGIPFSAAEMGVLDQSLETRESLLSRLQGSRIITDDNMGTEWN
jgi:spermidine synthase